MIICGASAYSRDWDYARIRRVADEVGAFVLAILHILQALLPKVYWILLLNIAILLPLLLIKHFVDQAAALF